jgi:hypothetical protein
MATDEIFNDSVRTAGDLAGVFEYDGETGYFYLYDTTERQGKKILDSIRILSGEADFSDADISIRWDLEEQKVGLFIRNVLWAVFDGSRLAKYGGNYKAGAKPSLPPEVERGFGALS